MKNVAKWIAIIWSLICLVGVLVGLSSAGKELDKPMSEYEQAGAGLGLGCGLGVWIVLWVAIAGPAGLVYLFAGRDPGLTSSVQPVSQTVLCPECGKYGPAETRFCPHCGSQRG